MRCLDGTCWVVLCLTYEPNTHASVEPAIRGRVVESSLQVEEAVKIDTAIVADRRGVRFSTTHQLQNRCARDLELLRSQTDELLEDCCRVRATGPCALLFLRKRDISRRGSTDVLLVGAEQLESPRDPVAFRFVLVMYDERLHFIE